LPLWRQGVQNETSLESRIERLEGSMDLRNQIFLWANGSLSLRRIDSLEESGELKDTEIIIVGWESDRENMNELSKYLDDALRRVRR
jgi:hypothetical protein